MKGVHKSFGGIEVLHGVDLDIRGGRVLALLGENGAGKSTAVKILTGDHRADAGTISVDGEIVAVRSPRDAKRLGFRVIYQEFSDAPDLTVAENISLGALPSSRGVVNWSAVRAHARSVLGELDVEIDPLTRVGALGVAERQILEIARALDGQARLLVLDEPTSALSADEVTRLFTLIGRFRAQGMAIVYITHRLDEVEQLADDVVVFRDGAVVASGTADEFDRDALIAAMIGRELLETTGAIEAPPSSTAGPVLSLRSVKLGDVFTSVDLDVQAGEITAVFGRVGCGAVELAEAIFGLRAFDDGTMTFDGREWQPRHPADAIRRGIGFVPADRKQQGLLVGLSVSDNVSVANWRRLATGGVLRPTVLTKVWKRWREVLGIDARGGARQDVSTLSGGNQQKTMLGRWLEHECRLLVLVEPTRGVDVGARAEIYRVLDQLASRGAAVIVVSSDVEEVARLAHTVHVMSKGRIVERMRRPHIGRAALIAAASSTAETTR